MQYVCTHIYRFPFGTDRNSRPDEDEEEEESSPNKEENRALSSFFADLIPRSKSSATEVFDAGEALVCCFVGDPNETLEAVGGEVESVEPDSFGVGAVAETIKSATLFEYFSIFFVNRSASEGFDPEEGRVGVDVDGVNGFLDTSVFGTDDAVY
jgi:hypothetical protein